MISGAIELIRSLRIYRQSGTYIQQNQKLHKEDSTVFKRGAQCQVLQKGKFKLNFNLKNDLVQDGKGQEPVSRAVVLNRPNSATL